MLPKSVVEIEICLLAVRILFGSSPFACNEALPALANGTWPGLAARRTMAGSVAGASGVARAFARLGEGAELPTPGAGAAEWAGFAWRVSVAPLVLLLAGVGLWCVFSAWRRTPPDQSARVAPRVARARWARHGWPAVTLGVQALSALVLLGLGARGAVGRSARAFEDARTAIGRGEHDLKLAAVWLRTLNTTCTAALREMATSSAPCPPGIARRLDSFMKQASWKVRQYMDDISDYGEVVFPAPEQVVFVRALIGRAANWASLVLSAPALLLSLVCVGMFCNAASAPRACRARAVSWLPLLALSVVLLATALELAVGVAGGVICGDADAEVLHVVVALCGPKSFASNVTRHYLQGVGDNPVVQELDLMEADLSSADLLLNRAAPSLVAACPGWTDTVLREELRASIGKLQDFRRLLLPQNVYPLYREVVHGDVCGAALDALAFAVVTQAAVCLGLVPAMVATARAMARASDDGVMPS